MTENATVPIAVSTPEQHSRVLQRVIFPRGDNLDVIPLYVETDLERGAALTTDKKVEVVSTAAAVGNSQRVIKFGADLADLVDPVTGEVSRRTARIRAGRRVSFATYFNAFPASYWRRWTDLSQVTLRIRVSGQGTVIIYRSNAKGNSHPVETYSVDSETPVSIDETLPLKHFIDGGWYWFDVAASGRDVTLHDAEYVALTDRTDRGTVSIGITTFNRPDFCLDQLRALGSSEDVLDLVDKIYVVDQGTDRIREHAEFADSTKLLGEVLEVIEQPNLGGSGGFSRAMDETLRAERSRYVLLLDDDVVGEPESILRAATFADLTNRPAIVGGHMFSLHDRSVLNAFGETVARYSWWWGKAPHTERAHDFGRAGLRHTPWLHRRVDVDYNGWWMCLIPTSVVRDLGLAIPVFIKWDDAEYGLRAQAAGVPTVSLPGVAVWHVPWEDKNDAVDWQAYYHLRNRALAALLHSPFPRGGRLLTESMQVQLVHLLALQYSTAVLRLKAIEDLLAGPQHLHAGLADELGQLRQMRSQFTDAVTRPDVESFPAIRRERPRRSDGPVTPPRNPVDLLARVGVNLVRQLVAPVKPSARRNPEEVLPYQDAQWWSLAGVDSALVSAADGTSTAWYLRDRDQFRELLQRSIAAHAKLAREWPRLREVYREHAREITSPEQWRSTFGVG